MLRKRSRRGLIIELDAVVQVAQADALGAAVPQKAGDGHDEVRQERRAVDGVADGLLDFSAAW